MKEVEVRREDKDQSNGGSGRREVKSQGTRAKFDILSYLARDSLSWIFTDVYMPMDTY